jgi:hypothetical protein
MPSTYTLISSNVLTTTATSVTFSAIPSTYTDLVLRCSTRGSTGTGAIRVTFNGDTATNYSDTALIGNGSAASSSRDTSQNEGYAYNTNNFTTYTANTFSNSEFYIPNYLVSANKPLSSFGVQETNDPAAGMATTALLWRNTAAITSITLGITSFVAGSSFYLYGIKNS